ncbi:TonB-dependent receptor [Pseudoxanthomonas winnipegensis]|uniref:TonB-dependent receptor n=2 Tax=Pseudoxanthomonas winnipegensis TaxID=2480810 RepID=A0A4V6MKM7_9GAMM|nr:TonB-dependent receptor [Pseudoxanthomonas winnipegensis]
MESRQSPHVVRSMLFWVAVALSGAVDAQEVIRKTDSGNQPTDSGQDDQPTQSAVQLDTVQVTGTRIKGGTTPSPVITLDSTRIHEEGFTDLGEVIRSVPQNFGGGQNPGVAVGAAAGGPANQNITGGSSLNLRGLGPDASLTLLNGRRLAYSGFAQAVDLSAIPLEAVDRLEIVPDGASAVYGSDAVGGVANVILKRDFDGITVGGRYGGATGGGLATREATATAGTTWASGGLIAAWKQASNDPIRSDQRGYARTMLRPSTLWPDGELRSGILSLHQDLGETAELQLDGLRSARETRTSQSYGSVYYPYRAKTHTTLVAPSLRWRLGDDWSLHLGVALGKDKTEFGQPAVLASTGHALSSGTGAYSNASHSYELGVEGAILALPAGDARLAAGVGYRSNDFLYRGYADGAQASRFAYAEVGVPLVDAAQGIRGIERLELSGAVRSEDGDYGRVNTPKLGMIYAPSGSLTFKAAWGKSFKAPTLMQRFSGQTGIYYPASTFGATGLPADATALWLSGGNRNLRPERARTRSASLAFHPVALPGLEAELTWFDIDYTQRILQPITSYDVFNNPLYADFVVSAPSAAEQSAALAGVSDFYNYVGSPYDPGKVAAIIDGRYVNASQQRIKGVDLSGSYRFEAGRGHLAIRGSASWLDSTQSIAADQAPVELAGTLFHPARISARLGLVWDQDGLTASLFGNYKEGVKDTTRDTEGASFTTMDAILRYQTGAGSQPWSGLALELSGQNLLDRAPPSYLAPSSSYAPYDSTNYSAVGRFLSVSVSKHW